MFSKNREKIQKKRVCSERPRHVTKTSIHFQKGVLVYSCSPISTKNRKNLKQKA